MDFWRLQRTDSTMKKKNRERITLLAVKGLCRTLTKEQKSRHMRSRHRTQTWCLFAYVSHSPHPLMQSSTIPGRRAFFSRQPICVNKDLCRHAVKPSTTQIVCLSMLPCRSVSGARLNMQQRAASNVAGRGEWPRPGRLPGKFARTLTSQTSPKETCLGSGLIDVKLKLRNLWCKEIRE